MSIREVQSKTTIWYQDIPIRMASIKKTKKSKGWQKSGATQTLYIWPFGQSTLENCFAESTDIICNSSKLETTQLFINRRMDKWTVAYSYSGTRFSKKQTMTPGHNTDATKPNAQRIGRHERESTAWFHLRQAQTKGCGYPQWVQWLHGGIGWEGFLGAGNVLFLELGAGNILKP